METLTRFAGRHSWDFAQLRINYFDWQYGEAREPYRVLEERNIPIMVMEPVRGGRLADLTPEANALLKAAHPDWSIASRALRFVKCLPQVRVILQIPCTACRYCCSGCPMEINIPEYLKIYNDYKVTGAWALSYLPGVQFKGTPADCIGCGACVSHCPQSICIPELMAELAELARTAQ